VSTEVERAGVDWDDITSGGYRGRLLNWETYCTGEPEVLWQGEGFRGRVDSARSAGRQWASRHGIEVRTAIITPSSGDTVGALSGDLAALSDQLSDGEIDNVAEVVKSLAKRAVELTPRFAWWAVGMENGDPLPPDMVALAKRLKAERKERGEFSDQARRDLHKLRYPEPETEPVPDPVAVRRERLSDQLSDGEGREVLQARRAGHGGRRAKRSDQAAQSG
jgi:hypothetical protein